MPISIKYCLQCDGCGNTDLRTYFNKEDIDKLLERFKYECSNPTSTQNTPQWTKVVSVDNIDMYYCRGCIRVMRRKVRIDKQNKEIAEYESKRDNVNNITNNEDTSNTNTSTDNNSMSIGGDNII